MNSAVFGKTMENVRLHTAVNVCTDAKMFVTKIVPNTRFLQSIATYKNLVFCKMKNKEVLINKLIFLRGSRLDIRKLQMCKFYYGVIRKKYGHTGNFFNSDTNLLMYGIKTDDFYDGFSKDKPLSDHLFISLFT